MQTANSIDHPIMSIASVVLPAALLLSLLAVLWFVLRSARQSKLSWLRPKWTLGRKEAEVTIVDRIQLGPSHSICMIRAFDRKLVVGMAPAGWTVLMEQLPGTKDPTHASSFRVHLASFENRQGEEGRDH